MGKTKGLNKLNEFHGYIGGDKVGDKEGENKGLHGVFLHKEEPVVTVAL